MTLMMLALLASIISIIGGAFLHEGMPGGGDWPCLRCPRLDAAPGIAVLPLRNQHCAGFGFAGIRFGMTAAFFDVRSASSFFPLPLSRIPGLSARLHG